MTEIQNPKPVYDILSGNGDDFTIIKFKVYLT